MAIHYRLQPLVPSVVLSRLQYALPSILLGTLFNVLDAGTLGSERTAPVRLLTKSQSLLVYSYFLRMVPPLEAFNYKECRCTYSGMASQNSVVTSVRRLSLL